MKVSLRQGVGWTLFAASCLSVIVQLWTLNRIERENEWIAKLLSGHDIAIDKVIGAQPQVRLARAIYLRQMHRYDEALATLNLIIDQGGPELQMKTRYNLGNLYLAQAVEQTEALNFNEALPLAGLAKQTYRQALVLNSGFWDAKYNFEVAMRLLPEMNRVNIGDDGPESKKSKLWTTVPGFPRGLP